MLIYIIFVKIFLKILNKAPKSQHKIQTPTKSQTCKLKTTSTLANSANAKVNDTQAVKQFSDLKLNNLISIPNNSSVASGSEMFKK